MNRRFTFISYAAFAASVLIGIQILLILFRGEAACLNQGCQVVEKLTTVSPLYFNILGFVYFQTVGWLFRMARVKGCSVTDIAGFVLLAGIAVEGLLVSYQLFVVRTFCSYCLFLFCVVVLLNALAGWKQFIAGSTVLGGIIAASSLLSYGPSVLLSRQQTINNGTFGTQTCAMPKKELYLFFSADCPHCKNVLQALEGCNSCNFHFNPVERLDNFNFTGVNRAESYDPELNKLLLKVLGIDSIPVLLEKNQSGFALIKGEKQIIHYVRQACYQAAPVLYLDRAGQSSQDGLSVFSESEECSLNIECDKEESQK